MSRRWQRLEGWVNSLKSLLGKVMKAPKVTNSGQESQSLERKSFECRICLFRNHMDLLKRLQSLGCYIKVASWKVIDAKCEMTYLVKDLHRGSMDSYDGSCSNVGHTLVEVSSQLENVFDRDAMGLKRDIWDVIRSDAGSTQWSFASALNVVDSNWSLIFGHAKRSSSAQRRLLSAHAASGKSQADDAGSVKHSEDFLAGEAAQSLVYFFSSCHRLVSLSWVVSQFNILWNLLV